MAIKIEPERIFRNFLASSMTDINSSRSGQWIFDDFPRVESLGDNQFPRIGITKLDESSVPMGLYDDTQWETIPLQIDIITKKDLSFSVTTTDEALGTISNNPRLTYEYAPNTVTNIKHNGVAFGTVNSVDSDDDFTDPSALAAGTVEWSKSTGNLNFSSDDLTNLAGQSITSTSVLFLEGEKQVKYLARELIKTVRNNWRTDTNFTGLYNPIKISNRPIPFDEDLNIFRRVVEYRVSAINAGEGL
jgi:hypothetical protein